MCFFLQQWILLNVSGPPTLSVRVSHTACCLAGLLTGQEHPLLLVVGGLEGSTTLNDIWLLDVDGRRWKQVKIPIICIECSHPSMQCLFLETLP